MTTQMPHIDFYPHFLSECEAEAYMQTLMSELEFKSETYTFYGNTIETKRKMSFHSDFPYEYSGQIYSGKKWTNTLLELKEKVQLVTGFEFNAVLCNYYSDGSAGMGWHADKEKALGENPVIASLSLGQPRRFAFRPRRDTVHEKNPKKICEYQLGEGALLVMRENCQPNFEHSLLTDKSATKPRMNLTFRKIIN